MIWKLLIAMALLSLVWAFLEIALAVGVAVELGASLRTWWRS